MQIEAGRLYKNLKTDWYWSTKDGERIWRCTCQICQKPCYVREMALVNQIVSDCGCTEVSKASKITT